MTLSVVKNDIEIFNCEKIIYQTYECDFDKLPPEYKDNTKKWLEFHDGWIIEYSNYYKRKQEISEKLNLSQWAIKCFDMHPGITQADMWKYIIAYETGGVYADLDSIPMCIDSSEKIINSLDKKVDLITMPKGFQSGGNAANPSNFIFSKKSYLGQEFCNAVYKSLEIGGYFIKIGKKPPHPNTLPMFYTLIEGNIDRISQIYDENYVSHGQDHKPENFYTDTDIWRTERGWGDDYYNHEERIVPYTKEWNEWYNISKKSI